MSKEATCEKLSIFPTRNCLTNVFIKPTDRTSILMFHICLIIFKVSKTLSYFLITGEIFSNKLLDREAQALYTIPVAATDNGGRMGFTTVHVSLTDQNDNIPQFLAQEYKVTVLSTLPVNGTVLQVNVPKLFKFTFGRRKHFRTFICYFDAI